MNDLSVKRLAVYQAAGRYYVTLSEYHSALYPPNPKPGLKEVVDRCLMTAKEYRAALVALYECVRSAGAHEIDIDEPEWIKGRIECLDTELDAINKKRR